LGVVRWTRIMFGTDRSFKVMLSRKYFLRGSGCGAAVELKISPVSFGVAFGIIL
jgi:hypothetical protein